jgi:hypothetical protein
MWTKAPESSTRDTCRGVPSESRGPVFLKNLAKNLACTAPYGCRDRLVVDLCAPSIWTTTHVPTSPAPRHGTTRPTPKALEGKRQEGIDGSQWMGGEDDWRQVRSLRQFLGEVDLTLGRKRISRWRWGPAFNSTDLGLLRRS